MTKIINIRFVFVTLIILALFALFTGSAFAQNNNSNTRPGWGYGDTNHVHTGPPGLSVRPINNREDVAQFRAELRAYIQALREYIKNQFPFWNN